MTNQPSSPTLHRAFPWLSMGLLVSAGASWFVGTSPVAGRITLDVAALLLVALVLVVMAIDAVIARIGAGVALVLLDGYAAAVGVVVSCLGIAAGVGPTWPVFVIAAVLLAVPAVSRAARRRRLGSGSPLAALVVYLEPVNVVLRLVRGVNRFVGDSREDPGWNARHGIPPDRRARPR